MRLLIVTQVMDKNHPILGFFHRWTEEFAKHCEKVHVVCLYEGTHTLPPNVTVHSLGKEKGENRLKYLFNFYKYIWQLRKEYDSVFVHMNQIYVILGAPLWRLLKKKVGLWYAHGAVSSSLRIAEKMADAIVTSTPEGFRLKSKKVHIVGQGIDTEHFAYKEHQVDPNRIRILYVGRISPVKKCELLIEAVHILKEQGVVCEATLVGDITASETKEYYERLKKLCSDYKITESIKFIGGVPNTEIRQYLYEADIFANTGATGSLDKTGLEALSCGLPVVTANEAYADVFGEYADRLMYQKGSAESLAECIKTLHSAADRLSIVEHLKNKVIQNYPVNSLVKKILLQLA